MPLSCSYRCVAQARVQRHEQTSDRGKLQQLFFTPNFQFRHKIRYGGLWERRVMFYRWLLEIRMVRPVSGRVARSCACGSKRDPGVSCDACIIKGRVADSYELEHANE